MKKTHLEKSLPLIAALFVTGFAMAGFMFLGSVEKERNLFRYRAHALSQLNASSERLQNILNSSLLPIEGLSAHVSIHPAISRTEFDDFAKHIIAQHKNIHSLELVKGTVITGNIYPPEGNERAIGVDLMSLPADSETVRLAIDTKETVIAGPVPLIQGGVAFISRSPIFTASGKKSRQKDQYWGLAQAIITTETVFKEAGFYDNSELTFAIRWKGVTDAAGKVFFGDRAIFQDNPVTLEIQLFNSAWQLAAIPKTGWASISETSATLKAIRLMISLALGCLVFVYLRTDQRMLRNKRRYKGIFNVASVSIWEEDISAVVAALDELKMQGIEDFRKYLGENPDFVHKAVQMVKVLDVNDATLRLYGAENKAELLSSLDKIFMAESDAAFKEILIAIAEKKTLFSTEAVNKNLQGEPINIFISVTIPSETSEFSNLIVSIFDITKRKQAEEKLNRFEDLFSEITDLTYILDTKGNILFANKMFEEFTGRRPEEFIGKAFAPLFDEENLEKAMVIYENILRGEAMNFELTFKYTGILCEYKSFPFLDETGKVAGVMGIARDVTERKRMEDHIRQIAYFDSLTELPSRALFLDRIEQAILRAHRAKQMLAVLYLDLDNFKLINDTLGHEAGDAALREVAGRLKSCLREMDTVARLGGDEFVFILEEIQDEQDVALVAEKIISVLSTPVLLRGNTYTIGGSIGIAIYPEDAPDSDTLINNADIAMYRAKGKGGNNFRFYNEGA